MTQYSPHFSASEFTHSDTAVRLGLDNTPDVEAQACLVKLANTVAEPIRARLGVPLEVTDAYRAPTVNAADGGVPDSQHELGQALDFIPDGIALADAFDQIRSDPTIPFDQLILESGCIHASCAPDGVEPRREALIRGGTSGNWTYTKPQPIEP